MSLYAGQSKHNEFIVGTEINFVYRLKTDNPEKIFHPVHTLCEGMNAITLEKVKFALERMEYRMQVNEEIRQRVKSALDKMLMVDERRSPISQRLF